MPLANDILGQSYEGILAWRMKRKLMGLALALRATSQVPLEGAVKPSIEYVLSARFMDEAASRN